MDHFGRRAFFLLLANDFLGSFQRQYVSTAHRGLDGSYQHKMKDGKMDRKIQKSRGGEWKRARNKRRRQAIKRARRSAL